MFRILVILTIVALVFAGFYFGSVPDDWLSSYLSPVEEDPLPVLKLQRQDYGILVKGDGAWVKGKEGPIRREVELGQNNGVVALVKGGLVEGDEVSGVSGT